MCRVTGRCLMRRMSGRSLLPGGQLLPCPMLVAPAVFTRGSVPPRQAHSTGVVSLPASLLLWEDSVSGDRRGA